MKIIDAHMHFSHINCFKEAAKTSLTNYSYEGFNKECRENNIVKSICMGLTENTADEFPDSSAETPMPADLYETMPDTMYLCLGINPHRLSAHNLAALETMIKSSKKIVGVKIYAGYYHFDVHDDIYNPVYELCIKYDIPAVLHSGDTYSEKALLEYSRPLSVDRLAVKFRQLDIVICHLGDPWLMDACEVCYKNRNVFMDMSGMLVGSISDIERDSNRRTLDRFINALTFLNRYDRIVFGTDWPLVSMKAYIDLAKKIIPIDAYDDVFYNNALRIFKRINDIG